MDAAKPYCLLLIRYFISKRPCCWGDVLFRLVFLLVAPLTPLRWPIALLVKSATKAQHNK